MELLHHPYGYLLEQKQSGNYVNLPYNIIEGKRTERTEKVRQWLQEKDCPYILKGEDEAEDLLDDISGFLQDGSLEMPIDSSVDYFVKFNENIVIHIEAVDEYFGYGDYSISASIDGLIITENVTKEEIDKAVAWMKGFK